MIAVDKECCSAVTKVVVCLGFFIILAVFFVYVKIQDNDVNNGIKNDNITGL
jgi:hypothetical protein